MDTNYSSSIERKVVKLNIEVDKLNWTNYFKTGYTKQVSKDKWNKFKVTYSQLQANFLLYESIQCYIVEHKTSTNLVRQEVEAKEEEMAFHLK